MRQKSINHQFFRNTSPLIYNELLPLKQLYNQFFDIPPNNTQLVQ